MRFDDSLKTVLAAEATSALGAASAWRQIVDLIGRGRAPASSEAVDRLRSLRARVPEAVRTASARALAFAEPGAALVGIFAEDSLAVAAPVLRTAMLDDAAWLDLLPRLSPSARAVLRHRRDLSPAVTRGLEHFGSVDFVLPDASAAERAQGEPVEGKLIARTGEPAIPPTATPAANGYPISDLVARIDAFQRRREEAPVAATRELPGVSEFRFETDADGIVTWTDARRRAPLIGISLTNTGGAPQVDGGAAGAFRRRAAFRDARLIVAGASPLAGSWRISGAPIFDPVNGRFTGFRGGARRPRADESAASPSAASGSLRQLMHELRTPANAIAGFAEFIDGELLGPAPEPYRRRARDIRAEASALIDTIDDLDTAARIEGRALDLRPGLVRLAPIVEGAVGDLAPLAKLRGAKLTVAQIARELAVEADDRALARLVSRLLAGLLSYAQAGERLEIAALADGAGGVLLVLDRPARLVQPDGGGLFASGAEGEEIEGAPLLGAAFALRLAQRLAIELGGGLHFERHRLTLQLPAAVTGDMGQAHTR